MAGKAEHMFLKIENINRHRDLQMRHDMLSESHANDIAEDVKKGAELPEIKVALIGKDEETIHGKKVEPGYYVYDGFHEMAGIERAGGAQVRAVVTPMTWKEAVLEAARANSEHKALKRSPEDKVRAVVETIVATHDDPKGPWSNRRVAEHCKVSDTFVGNWRYVAEERLKKLYPDKENSKRVGKNGVTQAAKKKGPAIQRARIDWDGCIDRLRWITKFIDVALEMSGIPKGPEFDSCHTVAKELGQALKTYQQRIAKEFTPKEKA